MSEHKIFVRYKGIYKGILLNDLKLFKLNLTKLLLRWEKQQKTSLHTSKVEVNIFRFMNIEDSWI